ncbi:hypothetical protein V1264_012576 [Littorina saxatilis]
METNDNAVNSTGDAPDASGQAGATGGTGSGGSSGGGVPVTMSASQFTAECYDFNHNERGRAIIFNNKKFDSSTNMGERTGTDKDAETLYMILTEMGFDVVVKHDCTMKEMEVSMNKMAREDHSDEDCFACAILSHGEEGYVYGKDGPIQVDRLVAPFKGHRCRTLAGKPKIFFIQACRGTQLDDGVEVTDSKGMGPEDMEVEIRRIPTEADFLMAYSVVPGYFAWRNSTRGSWFVQALGEVFRENWKRMDLLSMMTRVSRKVAYDFESNASKEFMNRKKQIPCVTSMLTKDVYFTPKK